MAAMKQPTADAISIIMDNPSPTDSSQIPEIVVQVLNLNSIGNRYKSVSALFFFSFCVFVSDLMLSLSRFFLFGLYILNMEFESLIWFSESGFGLP